MHPFSFFRSVASSLRGTPPYNVTRGTATGMARSEDEIRSAIEGCLEQCYQDSSPVVKLAECVQRLREEEWDSADIRRVESSVLRLLARILSPTDASNEHEDLDLQ
jgi:hypothetical protein